MQLTKKYRLVWDDDKNIILNNEFENDTITYTQQNCYESQYKSYIDKKIKELGLVKNEL